MLIDCESANQGRRNLRSRKTKAGFQRRFLNGIVTSRIVADDSFVIVIKKNMGLTDIIPTVLLGIFLDIVV